MNYYWSSDFTASPWKQQEGQLIRRKELQNTRPMLAWLRFLWRNKDIVKGGGPPGLISLKQEWWYCWSSGSTIWNFLRPFGKVREFFRHPHWSSLPHRKVPSKIQQLLTSVTVARHSNLGLPGSLPPHGGWWGLVTRSRLGSSKLGEDSKVSGANVIGSIFQNIHFPQGNRSL